MEFLWDYRVVIDLFLGGVGIGIYLFSVYLLVAYKETRIKTAKTGFLLAPILVAVGVLALATELGKPFRMISTFVNVNVTSVTSWGGFLQGLFIIFAMITAYGIYSNHKDNLNAAWFKWILGVSSVFALAVGLYHGVLLTSLGRSGWESGLIPVMFFISSLLSAISVMSVIELFSNRKESNNISNSNGKILFILLSLQFAFLIVWRISIFSANADAIIAYNNLLNMFGNYWWIMVLLLGMLLPLLMLAYYLMKKAEQNVMSMFIIALLIVLGSYTFKHIIVYAGQIPIGI